MRLPSLAAGLLAILLLPRLLHHWLKPGECLVMSALIAISPFLINYSRIARPYAMLALLAAAAIPLAWYWWKDKIPAHGFAWVFCTVLAAWLNPVTLAVTMAPFLWFGLKSFRSTQTPLALLRLGTVALIISAAVIALLYLPFSNDWASLAVKSGVHSVSLQTFVVALGLWSGTGGLLYLLMVTLAIWGWLELRRRDAAFAWYLLVVFVASTIAVSLTGAEWIGEGIVLARYQIGLLPLFLALAAIGIAQISQKISAAIKLEGSGIPATLFLLLLFVIGPLPGSGSSPNQFMHHMAVQFDYNFDRNPILAALESVVPEDFYYEIAGLNPDGDAVVVETPWHLESNWNALPLYQVAHGQNVKVASVGGVCADRLYGELRQDIDGLEFKQFITLQSVLNGESEADYLVFRINHLQGARVIEMDQAKCEEAIRAALGAPWRETRTALVFNLADAS
jgi:hypothetical protein